jgi:hypothetical protein
MNKQPNSKIVSRLDNDGTFNVTIEFRFAADTYAADEALLAQGRKIFCQDFNVSDNGGVICELAAPQVGGDTLITIYALDSARLADIGNAITAYTNESNKWRRESN